MGFFFLFLYIWLSVLYDWVGVMEGGIKKGKKNSGRMIRERDKVK